MAPAAVSLASMAPLPEEALQRPAGGLLSLEALCPAVQRVGRWSSIESNMTFPSRMGSIDAPTPSMLFPGTPTPMGNRPSLGPCAFGVDQLAPQNSPRSAFMMSLTAASTAAPSTSSSTSELSPSQPTPPPDLLWSTMPGVTTVAVSPPLAPSPSDEAVAAAALWGMDASFAMPDASFAMPALYMPEQAQQFANLQTGYLAASMPSSAGSALHAMGKCSPCAWFWKAKGCKGGAECTFCHLCPQDELKKRKRAKLTAIRNGVLEPTQRRGPPGAFPEERCHPNLKLSNVLL